MGKVISTQWWGDIPSEDPDDYPDMEQPEVLGEDTLVDNPLAGLLVSMSRKGRGGAVQE